MSLDRMILVVLVGLACPLCLPLVVEEDADDTERNT